MSIVKLPTLIEKNYWVYRRRCQHCGVMTDSKISKTSKTYNEFVEFVTKNYFPASIQKCPDCGANAVFNLLAMTFSK